MECVEFTRQKDDTVSPSDRVPLNVSTPAMPFLFLSLPGQCMLLSALRGSVTSRRPALHQPFSLCSST